MVARSSASIGSGLRRRPVGCGRELSGTKLQRPRRPFDSFALQCCNLATIGRLIHHGSTTRGSSIGCEIWIATIVGQMMTTCGIGIDKGLPSAPLTSCFSAARRG